MKRRATYDDLMQLPDHLVAEIIDGELITSPRPAIPHANATMAISQDLGPFHRKPGRPGGPGGWWILYEPELHFGDEVIVPDLVGWRQHRMPTVPNAAYLELAPDWVCEVLSPRTGRIDRTRKMAIYARESTQHLWLVDPIVRTLEVYRLEDARWVVVANHGGDVVVRAEPFEAVELDLNRGWPGPAETPG